MSRRPRKSSGTREALELVGLGHLVRPFENAFRLMGIAEDEILEAARANPGSRREIWNSFKVLDPGELAVEHPEVYRHHVRELLARVVEDRDLRPATRAEVCWAISRMTLASRLDRDVELLGLTITSEIFGRDDLVEGRESYPGAMAEVEREFRRKLARPDRQLREDLRDPPAHFLERLAS